MALLTESREVASSLPAERVWQAVTSLGGEHGWYAHELDLAWEARGTIDELIGGPGTRRGRPARPLQAGDQLDFWTVLEVTGRRLVLRADMKLPGTARVTFEVRLRTPVGCTLYQETEFDPHGLAGYAYWFASLPCHRLVFRRHVRAILKAAADMV